MSSKFERKLDALINESDAIVHQVEFTVDAIREFNLPEPLATTFDEAQGDVFSGKADEAFIIVRVVP